MLRVKDGRGMELLCFLQGVLLQVLVGEDVLDCLVEVNVVNFGIICRYAIVGLEIFVLFIGQGNLLSVKDTSELLLDDLALSQGVVVLEKLAESDAVLLDLSLKLEHQLGDLSLSNESPLFANVLILLGHVKVLHMLLESLERGAIIDELEILNLVIVSAIDGLDCSHLLVRHGEAEVVQSLSKLLRGHLEVFVTVPVLEEALGVKSISCQPFSEGAKDDLNYRSLISGGI